MKMSKKITNFELFDIVLNGDEEELKELLSEEVELEGWVRTNRANGQIGFIEFNDGTYFKNVQLVYLKESSCYELASSYRNGCAIKVVGKIKITPEITTNDGEGAGNVFDVTTHDTKDPFSFYGRKVNLTVTGQLHVEPFALAFRNVYTFGPVFRAEHSNTVRHASEFWMIEPEMAFCDLNGNMAIIEDCIKYCINYVMEACPEEMKFFNTMIDPTLIDRLNHVVNSEFKKMSYSEGIEILKNAVKNGVNFENSNIEWGMDLQSEHERYLTEKVVNGPLFLIDYPEEIKAFYMKLNPDKKTVAACDLLVPAVGELVGGSQREENYELLKAKMDKLGLTNGLEWYLDTRKYGGCVHSGFGIGFDRLLMYVTGMQNIRDVQPYPRTSGSIKY